MAGAEEESSEEEEEQGRRPTQAERGAHHTYTLGNMRAVMHGVARARRETMQALQALRQLQQEPPPAAPVPAMNPVLAQAHYARMARAMHAAQAAAQTLAQIEDADMDDL